MTYTQSKALTTLAKPPGHRVPGASLSSHLRMAWSMLRLLGYLCTPRARYLLEPVGTPLLQAEMHHLLDIFGCPLTVQGEENLQADGQLMMWNQTSHLDHFILGAAIGIPYRSLYNVEVSRVPIYGHHLQKHGHFLLDRRDEHQWRASIEQAAAWMRQGNTVLVSPEGTRSWDNHLLPFKRGAFMLAIQAQKPIVPVLVQGAYQALPRGRFCIEPGPLTVTFGKAIPTLACTEATQNQLQEIVREAMIQRLHGSAA